MSRVLLIGAGGLGCPAALALLAAPAGLVSGLTLVDPDVVELSNLHRQTLYTDADLGRPKVEAACDALHRLAPTLPAVGIRARLTADNAAALLPGHAALIEGSDSIATKFLVNDLALRLGIPAVIGGVVRWSGQVLTVLPGRGMACYRCLFEEEPTGVPTCQEAGVLGPSCGVLGALLAAEALRLLRSEVPRFAGAILTADLLAGRFRRVPIAPRAGCPACAACATTK
ncbi:MAG: HesA/MoeB/ThiF family protein [Myxococcales bacterium]|nr:HesA/MoeB/ThiF family protein [Myxococcota bacterium]MDW8284438.1 HesA/MoeB/ThiF family protein [Myxococcales bacterium]